MSTSRSLSLVHTIIVLPVITRPIVGVRSENVKINVLAMSLETPFVIFREKGGYNPIRINHDLYGSFRPSKNP